MADTKPPPQSDMKVFSSEQIAQIERLIETADQDLVYYRLSNRVIKRVSQLVAAAAILLLGIFAWFGYETKSDIDAEIKAQVGEALATYIEKNGETIFKTLKQEVQKQLDPIVKEEIDGLISNEIEPRLTNRLERYQAEIDSIESTAFSELRDRAVRLFPALDVIQKLEDATGGLPAAFSELVARTDLADVRSASNQNLLSALAEDKIPTMSGELSAQNEKISGLNSQLNQAEAQLKQLAESINSIGEIERAALSMCRFYTLVSPDVLAELFNNAPPDNNPELASEFKNVLNQIYSACKSL